MTEGHAHPLESAPPVEASGAAPSRSLQILFVLPTLGSLRYFQSALEALVERGHRIRLLLEGGESDGVHQEWLDGMQARPNFACEVVDLKGRWHKRGVALRRGMEYAQFLGPRYDGKLNRLRALNRPPGPRIRRLTEPPVLRSPAGLWLLRRSLGVVERALPSEPALEEYLDRARPDVIALANFSSRGSLHTAFSRAGPKRGIPTASCIRSWDNLTLRSRMTAVPHRVFVWNETQRQEAVELHGVPPERVVLTGAPNFDDWFDWQPRPRDAALGRFGLDPTRPVIFWVGGTLYGFERRTEAELVTEWLETLRSANDPALREAGVLIRPHPRRAKHWVGVDVSRFGGVVLWLDKKKPIATEQKADYYDAIYHASAVVGVNTSAMIEAAIVGRPVLTILDPDFHIAQRGTLHLPYLLDTDGGVVRTAESMQEHFAQLGEILAGRDAGTSERSIEFVARFVRPHGLDIPAADVFCAELERLAAEPLSSEREPLWVKGGRRLIVAGISATDDRQRRRFEKRLRRLSKPVRRFVRALRRTAGTRFGRA